MRTLKALFRMLAAPIAVGLLALGLVTVPTISASPQGTIAGVQVAEKADAATVYGKPACVGRSRQTFKRLSKGWYGTPIYQMRCSRYRTSLGHIIGPVWIGPETNMGGERLFLA